MNTKVLIIEDDFIIQMFLENIISSIGCNIVATVDNSDDGIKMIEEYSPDIILMDIGIAGKKDGIEMAELINEKFQIPFIFITGNSDFTTIDRAKKTSPIHIFNKPIEQEVLSSELIEICKKIHTPLT